MNKLLPSRETLCLPMSCNYVDELLTFETPVEFQKNMGILLWEVVIYIPPALRDAAQKFNLTIYKMVIRSVLTDGSAQSLLASFEPGGGSAA